MISKRLIQTPNSKTNQNQSKATKINQNQSKVKMAMYCDLTMSNEKVEEVVVNIECPICYEVIGKDKCTSTCGHTFCSTCFIKSFMAIGKCALCRSETKIARLVARIRLGRVSVNVNSIDEDDVEMRKIATNLLLVRVINTMTGLKLKTDDVTLEKLKSLTQN